MSKAWWIARYGEARGSAHWRDHLVFVAQVFGRYTNGIDSDSAMQRAYVEGDDAALHGVVWC